MPVFFVLNHLLIVNINVLFYNFSGGGVNVVIIFFSAIFKIDFVDMPAVLGSLLYL